MGNPHQGEVELKAGGKSFTLCMSIDAICRLESLTEKTFPALAIELGDPKRISVTLVRSFLWAALYEHHKLTLEQAGDLIPRAGGVMSVVAKINDAHKVGFPDAEASGTPRPPNREARRRAGTGRAS